MMADQPRRASILERSKALRKKATEFSERLADARARDFIRSSVLNFLDDVDRFFLGDANSRPSEEMWETMWLDNAETVLGLAETSFSKFEKQVSSYGGPENVRLVG